MGHCMELGLSEARDTKCYCFGTWIGGSRKTHTNKIGCNLLETPITSPTVVHKWGGLIPNTYYFKWAWIWDGGRCVIFLPSTSETLQKFWDCIQAQQTWKWPLHLNGARRYPFREQMASSAMTSIRSTKFGWKLGTFSRALLFGPFALKGMIKCLGKNSGMTTR